MRCGDKTDTGISRIAAHRSPADTLPSSEDRMHEKRMPGVKVRGLSTFPGAPCSWSPQGDDRGANFATRHDRPAPVGRKAPTQCVTVSVERRDRPRQAQAPAESGGGAVTRDLSLIAVFATKDESA